MAIFSVTYFSYKKCYLIHVCFLLPSKISWIIHIIFFGRTEEKQGSSIAYYTNFPSVRLSDRYFRDMKPSIIYL